MFIAECKKNNIDISFGQATIDYFFNHRIFFKTSDNTVILDTVTKTMYPFEPM